MNVGLIVIGTEILTGKRADRHLPRAIETLGTRGLDLTWCQYLADDPDRITALLRDSMAGPDVVFCFGGIGATPDDHTRAAAAHAAGLPLARHPELAAIIEGRFGAEAHPQRIRMADLPRGCELIPNPVNQIAGFRLGNHHFVPGFPQMAWPMMDWALDAHYRDSFKAERPIERLLKLPNTGEGAVIEVMEALLAAFPEIQLSCLPHMDGDYRETELGLRGPEALVTVARSWLEGALHEAQLSWVDVPAEGDSA